MLVVLISLECGDATVSHFCNVRDNLMLCPLFVVLRLVCCLNVLGSSQLGSFYTLDVAKLVEIC